MTSDRVTRHRDMEKRKARSRARALSALAKKYPEEFKELRDGFLAEEVAHHNRIFGITEMTMEEIKRRAVDF